MFYDDAIIGNQVLGLKWMGDSPHKKLHVGFPEIKLQERSNVLVENGFKNIYDLKGGVISLNDSILNFSTLNN